MSLDEAERLVNKCMTVLVSCKTRSQLKTAIRYTDLAYKRLIKESANSMIFIIEIERATGWALSKIGSQILKDQ